MTPELPHPHLPHGSLHDDVTAWAVHASPRALIDLLAGSVTVATVALFALPTWPLAAMSGIAAAGAGVSIALWGLAYHAAARRPRRWLAVAADALVVCGIAFAVLCIAVLMVAALGRPWKL